MYKKFSHFRDGMYFKGEIVETKEGKLVLHCECEDRRSKDLWGFELKPEEVKIQTNYLVDDLDSFLKILQVGLLGTSQECTLVLLRQDDNNVILSVSYRTELVNREFEILFRKFHRNETERISHIVNDLQKDIHNLQMNYGASLTWHPLKLLNGCTDNGREPKIAPPSWYWHHNNLEIRGFVRFPAHVDDGIVVAKLPKEFFPVDYDKVFKQTQDSMNQLTFNRVDIRKNGDIFVHNPTPNAGIFLDGMSICCKKN